MKIGIDECILIIIRNKTGVILQQYVVRKSLAYQNEIY